MEVELEYAVAKTQFTVSSFVGRRRHSWCFAARILVVIKLLFAGKYFFSIKIIQGNYPRVHIKIVTAGQIMNGSGK